MSSELSFTEKRRMYEIIFNWQKLIPVEFYSDLDSEHNSINHDVILAPLFSAVADIHKMYSPTSMEYLFYQCVKRISTVYIPSPNPVIERGQRELNWAAANFIYEHYIYFLRNFFQGQPLIIKNADMYSVLIQKNDFLLPIKTEENNVSLSALCLAVFNNVKIYDAVRTNNHEFFKPALFKLFVKYRLKLFFMPENIINNLSPKKLKIMAEEAHVYNSYDLHKTILKFLTKSLFMNSNVKRVFHNFELFYKNHD